MRKIIVMVVLSVVLSGCGGIPKDPQGIRNLWDEHTGDQYYPKLQMVAPMPLAKAMQIVKSKSQECLNVTLNIKSKADGGGWYQWQMIFESTVSASAKKGELFFEKVVHRTTDSYVRTPQVLADFYPASANSTKVVIYHLSYDPSKRVANSIASWLNGNTAGCPDMQN